jgi:hypothetical protein
VRAPLDPADWIALDVLDSQGHTAASGQPVYGGQTLENYRVRGGFGTSFTITADANLLPGRYRLVARLDTAHSKRPRHARRIPTPCSSARSR